MPDYEERRLRLDEMGRSLWRGARPGRHDRERSQLDLTWVCPCCLQWSKSIRLRLGAIDLCNSFNANVLRREWVRKVVTNPRGFLYWHRSLPRPTMPIKQVSSLH